MRGIAADWARTSARSRCFLGKAMMWIFLLSDTFIFSCFLLSYMTARMSRPVPWPNPSEVFALKHRGQAHPAHPDRHHDLRPDQQQRDDGDGRQFRLSPGSRQNDGLMLATAGIRAHASDAGSEWTK